MNRGKPFYAALTKADLTDAIREELKAFDLEYEFESVLISGLIAEKHYYCSKKKLMPTRFRKMFRLNAPYDFQAFFPDRGWHPISWRQCIRPRDELDWLTRALRDAIQPIVARYKSLHPFCEICGQNTDEIDHVAPEFKVMANQAISLLNEKQLEEAFDAFDWWSKEPFRLALSNPAVVSIVKAHETAILRAVCKQCHRESARQRREIPSPEIPRGCSAKIWEDRAS